MKILSNINFLFHLTLNNIHQYFVKNELSKTDKLLNNSINWYGHATTLINMSGKVIITDPVLGKMLGYFKRVADIPYKINDKKVDYILLSHGHMDHMSFTSLAKLNKDAVIIIPKGYKKIIRLLGFKNIVLLHPGDTYKDKYIKIKAFKANHDGRRFYIGIDNESISYLIERNNKKVFFAGDTAFTHNFDGISADVALMPVGCYKPERFLSMHCSPVQSYNMFKKLDCPIMIPIHYKTFKISLENFNETLEQLMSFHDSSIKIIEIGETYKF